jgi:aspartate kinase
MSSPEIAVATPAKKKLVIQKYGGTSVGSIDRIKHVAAHIAKSVANGESVVAVISAMGDQTDELLSMAHQISPSPPRRELDMLLTAGERISMALVTIALHEIGCKAVSLTGSQSGIITDTVHGNARISRISPYRIEENLASGHVVIVAGFQGVSAESKEITTLGRGGSDLSAIALAASLSASKCQLYKDVDGVCSADPRIVEHAKVLSRLSWDSMTQMAWAGASVLHPRGAHLARKFGIPIEIKSSFNLNRPGTLVEGNLPMESVCIEAITHKMNMVLIKSKLIPTSERLLAEIQTSLWQQGESSQIQNQAVSQSGIDALLSCSKTMANLVIEKLKPALLNSTFNPEVIDCSIVTITGSGFWQSPETLDHILQLSGGTKFSDVKNNAITLAIDNQRVVETVKKLHEALIK